MGKRIMAGALIVVSVLFIVITIVKASEPTQTTETTPEEVQSAEHEVDPIQEVVIQEPQYNIIVLDRGNDYYYAQDIFARVVHRENSNEVDGEEASWEVASEIMNRVNDPDYPDNIIDVIYQKGQFDCLNSLYVEEPTDIEYEIVADIMENGSRSPAEIVFGAEFVQGSGVYKKIGNTYFCYK